MYASGMSHSQLDEILERSRRRKNELDAEYEESSAALQSEIDERELELAEQQAEAERLEAERRETEQATLRERARKEQIGVGEQDDDPFAEQHARTWGSAPASRAVPGPQEPPEPPESSPRQQDPVTGLHRQVRAGRFGRPDPGQEQEPDQESTPAAPPRPAPRRRTSFDGDRDGDDFSHHSWLR